MLTSLVSDENLSTYSVVGAHVVATDDLILQCPRLFPLLLQKAMKWLTFDAIGVLATTDADSPTSPALRLAK
jgi:hypothetical protein